MKKITLLKSAGILSLALMLAACQGEEESAEDEAATEEQASTEDAEESHDHEEHSHDESSDENAGDVAIEGFAHHYHTGDTVSLTAETDADEGDGHWHWYIRGGDEGEWETVEGAESSTFEAEAVDSQQIKAVLYDGDHNVTGESEPVTVTIDDHDSEVYEGYFDDEDIADREVTDWAGEWKSVYPYFENGDLDEVYEQRAEEEDGMTFEEYKEYYETGYATEVDNIDITEDGEFTFYDGDETFSGTYVNDGYEVLEYEAGNCGVRFVFELESGDEEAPQFVQFSDHNIAPKKSGHYHLYWGDDRDELLDEVDHWPTYYPVDYSTQQIVDDLLLH